ncbi:MAG: DUF1343 domain-containing protein [Candidatus Rokubacteria bacterium]|nr:DUF1343 domain-containing protein [Candidatus Rokubacteria bacterium]
MGAIAALLLMPWTANASEHWETLLDQVVGEAVAQGQIPGAVVLIGQRDRIVVRKAYGVRALTPAPSPMTPETIFDVASLTKVVATAPAIMLLVEQGKLDLDAPLGRYLPELRRSPAGRVTSRQLLTHTSGLPIAPPSSLFRDGRADLRALARLSLETAPGERFAYSDTGFILLGELIRRLAGSPMDHFVSDRLYRPLGMRDTQFRPSHDLRVRIAPTILGNGHLLRGEVQDQNAALLGGVAGHAGLFSTADDLALFTRMVLNEGRVGSQQLFRAATIRTMLAGHPDRAGSVVRGLGWDRRSPFSVPFLIGFPDGVGHTGFTGTSLWLDPATESYVILLTNRVPEGQWSVRFLRAQTSALAPLLIGQGADLPNAKRASETDGQATPVLTGLDVLVYTGFESLRGKRVGLVTNRAAVDRFGREAREILAQAPNLALAAIFSPEHGLGADLHGRIGHSVDPATGVPVWSLYGNERRPTSEMLSGIDVLVVDLPQVGVRYYTYLTTLGYILEAAAQSKIPVVVLDRPNPVNGTTVEGPLLDPDLTSFTGYHPLPLRYGMTIGELARLFNAERAIGADLQVLQVQGWRREVWHDETGLPWVNPSPNIRSLTGALLYAGVGLLESTNLSVGRGTDRPFELLGAPWIDPVLLAKELALLDLPGVRFIPWRFIPSEDKYAGEVCGGVWVIVTDRDALRPVTLGLETAATLTRLYPGVYRIGELQLMLGNRDAMRAIMAGRRGPEILQAQQPALEAFLQRRALYLLY